MRINSRILCIKMGWTCATGTSRVQICQVFSIFLRKLQQICRIFNIPVMFWRAARGRVGPNSRAVLHMAIFLLNPYGLYACILIPKWLASSSETSRLARRSLRSVRCPRRGRICQSVPVFTSFTLAKNVARRLQGIIWLSTPHFFGTRFAGSQARLRALKREQYMPIGARFARVKRRNECGCLIFIKKYDIIFKKRVCVRRWRFGNLTTLKKYDIINKKTSTADRHQCDRI